jgi:hypothetical protein
MTLRCCPQVSYDQMLRMRPLYPGSARQLGLIPTDGMPSLLVRLLYGLVIVWEAGSSMPILY